MEGNEKNIGSETIIQVIPIFKEGDILRKVLMDSLSDYSYLSGNLQYKNYTNGIVSGCEISTTENLITITKGIICYEECLYFISENFSEKYSSIDKVVILVINIMNIELYENLKAKKIKIYKRNENDLKGNDIEICRFKLQKGAVLRYDYVDFYDRNTEFDTINTIYTRYSGYKVSGLSPEITKDFARKMLKNVLNDFDILFCMKLLESNKSIHKDVLNVYLSKHNIEVENNDNINIYKGLCEILENTKNNIQIEAKPKKEKRRAILID